MGQEKGQGNVIQPEDRHATENYPDLSSANRKKGVCLLPVALSCSNIRESSVKRLNFGILVN